MTAARQPLLSCKGVSKHFGALAAVNNLSFDVEPGEILGIGGPNGAGKTTLFEVISGLNPASAGSIVFDGRDITRLPPEAICHAGIARTFQLNASFESLSVRDNVRVAAYPAELSANGLSVYSGAARHARGDVTEPRSAQNGWMNTTYRYEPARAQDVSVAEAPATGNSFRKIVLRGGSRAISAVVISWEVVE